MTAASYTHLIFMIATCGLGMVDPPEAAEPAAPEVRAAPSEAAVLAQQLGSRDFAERQAAAAELSEMGSDAYEALRKAYQACDDLEVRLAIQQIVRDSFFEERLFSQHGFLGIGPVILGEHDDPHVPPGRAAVYVSSIVENSSAAAAGLHLSDLILTMDGQPFPREVTTDSFSERIREAGPGTIVRLGVQRVKLNVDVAVEIEVTLGRRPMRYYLSSLPDQPYLGWLEETAADFGHWWADWSGEQPSAAATLPVPQPSPDTRPVKIHRVPRRSRP